MTVDLSSCAQEPIHTPQAVQPHGALFAFDPSLRLVAFSANAEAMLGLRLALGHTPHTNVVDKYVVKAKNGFWHSFYFTSGTFDEPIGITAANHSVTEGTCRYCHQAIAESLVHGSVVPEFDKETGLMTSTRTISCTRCHIDVGHDTH